MYVCVCVCMHARARVCVCTCTPEARSTYVHIRQTTTAHVTTVMCHGPSYWQALKNRIPQLKATTLTIKLSYLNALLQN